MRCNPLLRNAAVLVAAWLALVSGTIGTAVAQSPNREVLVMFKKGVVEPPAGSVGGPVSDIVTIQALVTLLNSAGIQTIEKTFPWFNPADTIGVAARTGETVYLADISDIYTLSLPPEADPTALIAALNAMTESVVYAEASGGVRHCLIPTDEFFNQQWALHNTGQTGGTVDADIDAPEAWDLSVGTTDVSPG